MGQCMHENICIQLILIAQNVIDKVQKIVSINELSTFPEQSYHVGPGIYSTSRYEIQLLPMHCDSCVHFLSFLTPFYFKEKGIL